ncbi:cell wall hydrolase [Metabacillus arenae]|uniref:Cell wall hydrolase n=1 Tax=Metabacillus arenae TaxID=2771434 RepID=A0A926RZE6_9BACI|nr:cell wall hydrolase [Metabacillus arenae]MBD1378979.1 cell wall hydrolase [Metabacillus arenae]
MIKKFVAASSLAVSVLAFGAQADAKESNHVVKEGDTLYKLGMQYGVSVQDLQTANNKNSDMLIPGEELTIPASITAEEKDLLARLVQAEAVGEPYAGKVAVATVVLNRVESNLFPNTIHGVIYDGTQFEPVLNGEINKPAGAEAKKAVSEALAFHGQGNNSLFFYNPKKAQNDFLENKQVTVEIGDHVFLK